MELELNWFLLVAQFRISIIIPSLLLVLLRIQFIIIHTKKRGRIGEGFRA